MDIVKWHWENPTNKKQQYNKQTERKNNKKSSRIKKQAPWNEGKQQVKHSDLVANKLRKNRINLKRKKTRTQRKNQPNEEWTKRSRSKENRWNFAKIFVWRNRRRKQIKKSATEKLLKHHWKSSKITSNRNYKNSFQQFKCNPANCDKNTKTFERLVKKNAWKIGHNRFKTLKLAKLQEN